MINSCWLWLPLLVLNTPQPYKKDAVQFWTTSLCLCFVAEGCRAVPLPAGISGVCSVARRIGVERALVSFSGFCSVAGQIQVESFLEALPWSCGLFPIEPIACNAARQDVDKPKEFTRTHAAQRILFRCYRSTLTLVHFIEWVRKRVGDNGCFFRNPGCAVLYCGCCAVLCCYVLCCVVLCCVVLCRVVPYCAVLCCAVVLR